MKFGSIEIDYFPYAKKEDFLPQYDFFESAKINPLGDSFIDLIIGRAIIRINNIQQHIKNELIKAHGPFVAETISNYEFNISFYEIGHECFLRYPQDKYEYRRFILGEDEKYYYFWTYHLAGYLDKEKFDGKAFLCKDKKQKTFFILNDFLLSYCSWWSIFQGGCMIHGASIIKEGKVYIFFGPSGIGKTTISKLSEGIEIISDEYSMVIEKDKKYYVYRSPQKKSITRLKDWTVGFPLEGLFRLKQDNSTYLEQISSSFIVSELLANLLFAHAYNVFGNKALINASSIIKNTKNGILHFKKDSDFWEVI